MTALLLAVAETRPDLVEELRREGVEVVGDVGSRDLAARIAVADPHLRSWLAAADALIVPGHARMLTRDLIEMCDVHGVRVVPLCTSDADVRVAQAAGITAVPHDADAALVLAAVTARPTPASLDADDSGARSRIVTVWGPPGAPGRTTVAIELAAELARRGGPTWLVDADSHAPSVAIALGLEEDGPGLAGGCRRAATGVLDVAELERVAQRIPIGGGELSVLAGINRPSRWPELAADRVAEVLRVCRATGGDVVVDVASSLETDEEIVSDVLDGPRRNAATLAALRAADVVVAVAAADTVGMARFLRAHADLRAVIGATPVRVVANRLRPGRLGVDARGQVRRTLDRFAGISGVGFLPDDPRAVDAAVLAARPVSAGSPRAPFAAAVRRFAQDALARPTGPGSPTRRGSVPRRGRALAP